MTSPFAQRYVRSSCIVFWMLWLVGSQSNGVDGYFCRDQHPTNVDHACTLDQNRCTDKGTDSLTWYCCANGAATIAGTCQQMCAGTFTACTCASKFGGTCGDTNAESCNGGSAAWKSGHCPGDSEYIKCCAGTRTAKNDDTCDGCCSKNDSLNICQTSQACSVCDIQNDKAECTAQRQGGESQNTEYLCKWKDPTTQPTTTSSTSGTTTKTRTTPPPPDSFCNAIVPYEQQAMFNLALRTAVC